LNKALKKSWQEWEIPRELPASVRPEFVEGRASTRSARTGEGSAQTAEEIHRDWWQARIAWQKEIDASIAAKAEFEFLYDKPYDDKKKVRVAGPFTVESLSPHRVLGVDENDDLIDTIAEPGAEYGEKQSFPQLILENLKISGVRQAHKEDRITFTALSPWPGDLVCADGRYLEGRTEKRAAIFIGPEFGTVTRPDLVAAAREAGDADFDVLIACAFNYEAHTTEFAKLGRIPVLKARMNADLHMADDIKNTGKGNFFVIFGEPDIDILPAENGQLRIKVNGVDVFHPNTGEVRSDGPDGIACWFIDTDYNMESFFVRHAYFLGANDPYSALKTTLKAEINAEAWATLNSDTSRPFDKPKSGRIAVKVINHLGGDKKDMRKRADEHFAALKQIIPGVSKLMLLDYDDRENSYHPKPGNPGLVEWQRKNIENYLLVPDAWKRAALQQMQCREDYLFAQPVLQSIDTFFADQNMTLTKGKTWQNVSADIFNVVDGKRILFERGDSLFHKLRSGAYKIIVLRELVAMSMTANEIHEDVHHFMSKLKALTETD